MRCAPPGNAPTPAERATCAPWLDAEWRLIGPHVRVIVALGGFAWRAALRHGARRAPAPCLGHGPKFGHGAIATLGDVLLIGCYHPSQQNTFTGRLTPAMLDDVFTPRPRIAAGTFRAHRDGVDCQRCDFRYSTSSPSARDQTTSDALAATVAPGADRRSPRLHPLLGGRAPQHARRRGDQPAGADRATSAAQTSQLRLGSGGVMLPNHAPLAVAEQFALLEAAAPGPHRPRASGGRRARTR